MEAPGSVGRMPAVEGPGPEPTTHVSRLGPVLRGALRYAPLWPMACLLGGFFLLPLGRVLLTSLGAPDLTLKFYREFFSSTTYLRILLITIEIGLGVTASCLVLGYALAFVMWTSRGTARALLMLCVLFPFWLSSLVRSYAWQVVLQRRGVLNSVLLSLGVIGEPIEVLYTSFAMYVGLTYVLLPFMVLPVYSAMTGVDDALLRASRSLGAGPVRTFVRVFFPLTLSGVGAGSLLVFILGVGAYITPALLGGVKNVTLAMLVERQIVGLFNAGLGSAIAMVLAAVSLGLFFVYWWGVGGERATTWRL